MIRKVTEVSFPVQEEDFKLVEREIEVSYLRSTLVGTEH